MVFYCLGISIFQTDDKLTPADMIKSEAFMFG